MQEVEARIEADMDPYVAARQMDTDEIVRLDELRDWLKVLVEMSYQGVGYRRVKNPRIWTMHDLDVLMNGGVHERGAATSCGRAPATRRRATCWRRASASSLPRWRRDELVPRGRWSARSMCWESCASSSFPEGVAGRVAQCAGGGRSRVPVQYGDALLAFSTASMGDVRRDVSR